ncbi:hypothetical protein GCM10020254_12310 [Streptomyces goshikiensis]
MPIWAWVSSSPKRIRSMLRSRSLSRCSSGASGLDVLDQRQGGLFLAHHVGEGVPRGGAVAVVGVRGVEGAAGVAVGGDQSLDDLFVREAEVPGEVGDGRRTVEPDGQLLLRLRDVDAELLEAARDADGPGGVAEVPLDLACDVRHGEGGELVLAGRVEPVDGLDQADGADLDDVLDVASVTPGPEAAHGVLDE